MQVEKGTCQKEMKLLLEVESSLEGEVRVSVAFLCLQGDVTLYVYFI